MTLSDLWILIKRSWKLVVACALVCTLAAGAYVKLTETKAYTATTIVNTWTNGAMAKAYANAFLTEYNASLTNGVTVTIAEGDKVNNVAVSYNVTATSATDGSACITAANEASAGIVAVLRDKFLPTVSTFYDNDGVRVYKSTAEIAEEEARNFVTVEKNYTYTETETSTYTVNSKGLKKFAAVGFCGGLFLALCIVIILDIIRRPVRGRQQIEDTFEAPVLGTLGSDTPEKLLANVSFATPDGAKLESVCLLPTANKADADALAKAFKSVNTAQLKGVNVIVSDPIAQNIDGAFDAKQASVTAIVVRQWKDNMTQLEETLREVSLAKANLAGVILIDEKK